MSDEIRLAVLGGSGAATPALIQALAERSDRPRMEVVLIGRTQDKLSRVAAVAERLAKESAGAPLRLRATTDLDRGLEGVDYVLNQIRVGGYAARRHDETFPHAFGLPGEETFGPGGMNNALRTIPVTLEVCRRLEAVAPQALLINLTNPSSYVQYAINRYTHVAAVGVCDSPVGLAGAIAAALGAPAGELWIGYVGMHHFGWVTEVRWRGRNVMPDLLARLDQIPGLPVDSDLVGAIGAIPSSYFRYYFHPDRMLAKQLGQPSRAEQLMELEARMLAEYEEPKRQGLPASLQQRGARWYEQVVVPVLLAHALDSRCVFVLNLPNKSTLPWMPAEAIVELPALVTRQGFYPLDPPPVPLDLRAMLVRNAACEMLWVEAVVERCYEKALRAMMLNPLVHNLAQARAILGMMWPGEATS